MSFTIRQADKPCLNCGSMFRSADKCNICASTAPVPPEFYRDENYRPWKQGKETEGMGWDKKSHKVIKPGAKRKR
jgi:hypothetical protein